MSGYCDVAPGHPVHAHYHDREYGFPTADETALFERLVLEINQAGLSWELMLKKREGFRAAYDGFDIDKVARYGERQRTRLLNDAGIIRNRLKVDAVIEKGPGGGAFVRLPFDVEAAFGSKRPKVRATFDGEPQARA